jgi:hypothetical protein
MNPSGSGPDCQRRKTDRASIASILGGNPFQPLLLQTAWLFLFLQAAELAARLTRVFFLIGTCFKASRSNAGWSLRAFNSTTSQPT